jgi:hypothetical protein
MNYFQNSLGFPMQNHLLPFCYFLKMIESVDKNLWF